MSCIHLQNAHRKSRSIPGSVTMSLVAKEENTYNKKNLRFFGFCFLLGRVEVNCIQVS